MPMGFLADPVGVAFHPGASLSKGYAPATNSPRECGINPNHVLDS